MNTIHFIGYSAVHPSTFLFEMVTAPGQYTLVIVATPVQFFLDGQWLEYPAGTAMLYAPGQSVRYRACRDTYQNDWIRFSSDDPLVTQFPLLGVPFPVSDTEYCHHLIKLLTWETSFATHDSDLIISNLLQVLFLRLGQDTALRQTSPHASALLHLRKKIYNSPWQPWNIPVMAKELHLSTGYTQVLYKQMFGISCMDDVIGSRIRLAREQLSYTEKPVAEIADACGYSNVEHFCRQFRQQTGMAPGVFRRRFAESVSSYANRAGEDPSARPSHATLPPLSGSGFLRPADGIPGEQDAACRAYDAKKTAPEFLSETVPDQKYADPAAFINLSHYNVAGPDMPSSSVNPRAEPPI